MVKLKLVGFFACAVIAETVFAPQSRAATFNATPTDTFSLSISLSGLVTTEGIPLTLPFLVTNNIPALALNLTFTISVPTFVSGESTDIFTLPTISGGCLNSVFVNGTCNGLLVYPTKNAPDFDGDSGVSTAAFNVSDGQNNATTGTYQMTIVDPTATPLPAAPPLFATGLGGLGLLGWRRKRKARA